MTQHSRQGSFASSYISSSAIGLGISNQSNRSTPTKNPLKIGPWKLGKTLGKGATGRVLLATNVNNGKKAAVKVVSKSALTSETGSDYGDDKGRDAAGLSYGIEREIIIMKLLNHKNVLRLYDVWETDKALYLVLEYVEGGELFDLLVESGPLPEDTAVEFFKNIVLGISYCHSLGICHRDLKPENLLLDKEYNIKIADFGMAALESNEKLLETSCGSPHYAAPEIVSGLQYHGSESDVWSCGVILFALLTGRLPFDDENIRDLLLKVQKGEYEVVENLSKEAKDLIGRMLTVDPEERIKTRDILQHPLVKKYPFNKQDLEDYVNLPSPNSATKPVNSREEIDKQILENLVILWHGRDTESIVNALLSPKSNPEKTFYLLLLRYRHDHNNSNSHTQELVRTSSVISKVTPTSSESSTPKKKRLSQTFSASSSHKKLISFQSQKQVTPTKPLKEFDISNAPPVTQVGAYNELVQQKRGMKVSPSKQLNDLTVSNNNINGISKRLSLTSSVSNKRNSMMFLNEAITANRNSLLVSNENKRNSVLGLTDTSDNKRNSILGKRKSTSKMKRNSVTTKLLSTYAKLASIENSKSKNMENYGRRTSADFATLCDMLFNGDGEDAEAQLANSSSIATLSALVFDKENKRSSRRISMSPQKRKSRGTVRQSLTNAKKRQSSYAALLNDSPTKKSPKKKKSRASSNPLERISRILNSNDLEQINRRSMSTQPKKRVPSVGPPPKPVSKLDPRYQVYEQYQKRKSLAADAMFSVEEDEDGARQDDSTTEVEVEDSETVNDDDQQSAAGTFHKDFISEMKRQHFYDSRYGGLHLNGAGGKEISTVEEEEQNGLASSNTVVRKSKLPTTLADVKVPQVTRRSKHFPDTEKRLSVLSIYSTKASSTNLAGYLKDSNTFGKDRASKSARLSMIFQDDDKEDTVDMQFQLETPFKKKSKKQTEEEELFFVDNSFNSANKRKSFLFSTEEIPQLKFKESKDTLISNSNSIGKRMNLPEIPGSPIKEKKKRKSQQSQFDIYDDEGQSKPKTPVVNTEEDGDYDAQLEAYSSYVNETDITPTRRAPAPPVEAAIASKNGSGKLQFPKQRKPLGNIDDATDKRNANENNKRSASFFRKMSFGKKQPATAATVDENTTVETNNSKRKVSLGQAFLALFGAGEAQNPSNFELLTILSQDDFFEALKSLLISWKQHGITDLKIEKQSYKIVATISKKNALGLKSCKFGCQVVESRKINKKSKIQANSKLIFSNLKGSDKSFSRLTEEIRRILDKEDILVN